MLGALAVSLFLSWVQVSSETYIVKSSAGEDRAKRVLRELEHFHQLVGTLVFAIPNFRNSEYFATSEVRDDTIWLGGLSADRMQLLMTASLIPLKTFFTIV